MITEDYVSFEVAKLLKEKGFNEPCWNYYVKSHIDHYFRPVRNNEWTSDKVSIPTLQMVMKWLREVHNLCIEPYRTAAGYLYTISNIPYGSYKASSQYDGDDEDSGQYTTYEKAVDSAIKYCLTNLIK